MVLHSLQRPLYQQGFACVQADASRLVSTTAFKTGQYAVVDTAYVDLFEGCIYAQKLQCTPE